MESLSTSVCRACRHRLLKASPSPSRTFATTSSRQYIPPESPAFIDVPRSLQQVKDIRPRAKGILPLPRELFPKRRPDKSNQEYLDNVTRDPLPQNILPEDQLTDTGKYKRRMAELRKTNLRSGLKELHARKSSIDIAIAQRSAIKRDQRARLIAQPERDDERLTNTSIPSAMRPQHMHELSPEEELEIYNTRLAAYQAKMAAKHEDRLDKLHTLYMNARSFITTKDQLAAAIEETFTNNTSIWQDEGAPLSVTEMIRQGKDHSAESGRGGTTISPKDLTERTAKDQERMKKIAERLSGGKL